MFTDIAPRICKLGHPIDGFRPDGRGFCSTCNRARARRWEIAHPDLVSRKNRRAYAKRPGVRRVLGWRRQGHVGMTPERFDRMLAAQNGQCAICRKPPKSRRLDVDHDHATGAPRGLLCMSCNRMVGRFERGAHPMKRLDLIVAVENYLARSPAAAFAS